MKNKKIVISIISVVALILITIGITYAYWLVTKTQEGEKGQGSYSLLRQGSLVLRGWEYSVYSLSWEGWRPGAGSLGTETEARESQGTQREDEEEEEEDNPLGGRSPTGAP